MYQVCGSPIWIPIEYWYLSFLLALVATAVSEFTSHLLKYSGNITNKVS